MMTEQDMQRIMSMAPNAIEHLIESDDYELDEADEQELIELLQIESLEAELDDGMNCGI